MKQENAYKIRLIKLLEILRQDSDEEHYVDTTYLLGRLDAMGIVCDRRTLYADIDLLNEYGYEVLCEKSPGKPNRYCVAERNFDIPELRILMDAVQASSFITPGKTDELVDKIAYLGGSHRGELLRQNIVKYNTTKSQNEGIFYAISEITAAIEQGKKVSFQYFDYDSKHKRVYRRDGRRYFVNPYATVFADDNYYLIAYYARFEGVVHYRIDRMDHVEMVETQDKDPYKGEKIDLKRHRKSIFGMFQGEEQMVEFAADKSLLDPIFDKFGDKVAIKEVDDSTISFKANVQVSPLFFGWCCSFGEKLKVTGPIEVTKQLQEYIHTIAAGYTSATGETVEMKETDSV